MTLGGLEEKQRSQALGGRHSGSLKPPPSPQARCTAGPAVASASFFQPLVIELVPGSQPSKYASFNLDRSRWRPRPFSLILRATPTGTFRNGKWIFRGKALSPRPALRASHKLSSWKLACYRHSLSHAKVAQSPTFPELLLPLESKLTNATTTLFPVQLLHFDKIHSGFFPRKRPCQ